jgi:lipoprotein-anchoring transpeptidase ErfK/SrfK
MNRKLLRAALAAAALATGGCYVSEKAPDQPQNGQAPTANAQTNAPVDPAVAAARQKARTDLGEVRFVVDISDRQLRILQGDRVLRTERVAVGSDEYPTPVGRWHFQRVDINPDWTPPDSEWAEKEEAKQPGEEDNPMGRARLLFTQDYSIHGTDETASLGTNQSHGSIRVANSAVLEVARLLLQAGGAFDGNDWFNRMTADRTRMHRIDLEHPVEITVVA